MAGIFADESWSVLEGSADGKPLIVRARKGFPSSAVRLLFAQLMVIVWEYEEANESGMPAKEEHARMQAFEDALERGLEAGLNGIQAACVTGAGRKEWRYYCSSPEAFMEALNHDLGEHDPYPIDIRGFKDPEWSALKELNGT
jgi:uncharacterized protein DUF695